ncbi:hypothetical protein BN2475_450018 [Paraburkholderia ribeironis]|uniref:Uncharacterized protein n=1 Tax=Paraburkholderia ribeironis TaxID=1247936 RepID=A0A1N7S8R5_9BURK|nr:hypothetical protein BN2475_450018 [Paraburkholderia ribeironis]
MFIFLSEHICYRHLGSLRMAALATTKGLLQVACRRLRRQRAGKVQSFDGIPGFTTIDTRATWRSRHTCLVSGKWLCADLRRTKPNLKDVRRPRRPVS